MQSEHNGPKYLYLFHYGRDKYHELSVRAPLTVIAGQGGGICLIIGKISAGVTDNIIMG